MRIEVPDGVVLNGELWRDYGESDRVFAILNFGDYEIARWDVTDREDEFVGGPGDYLTPTERDEREATFVSKFVGEKLAVVFAGLKEQQ